MKKALCEFYNFSVPPHHPPRRLDGAKLVKITLQDEGVYIRKIYVGELMIVKWVSFLTLASFAFLSGPPRAAAEYKAAPSRALRGIPAELREFIPEGDLPDTIRNIYVGGLIGQGKVESQIFASAKERYVRIISELDKQGFSFGEIFHKVCYHVVFSSSSSINTSPRSEIRGMFGGFHKWTKDGGKPVFQGRIDLALHFIYGGMIESYYGLGDWAAYEKERQDANKPGNCFDLDDMGATMLGARWARLSYSGFSGGPAKWIKPWALDEKTLGGIPKLNFGRLPHGEIASREQVEEVKEFVRSAIPADSSLSIEQLSVVRSQW